MISLLYYLYLWYQGLPAHRRLKPAYLFLNVASMSIRMIFVITKSKKAEEKKIYMQETNLRFISPVPYLISLLMFDSNRANPTLLENIGIYFFLFIQVFYVVFHILHLSSIRIERRFESRNIAILILHSVLLVQIIRWVFWR